MAAVEGTSGFRKPNRIERVFSKAFGVLVGLGLGLRHNYLLEVRGRMTGRIHATPVNVLEFKGKRFLVAGRGYTQWVRNAEAVGTVALRKGSKRHRVRLLAVPNDQKPEILKAYLDRFTPTVQRYFPVPAGSEPSVFVEVADRYPVFELLSSDGLEGWAGIPTGA
jgi:deazaflavin-dependent oxidoreductase (nitroreductase family)